jgi:hypothetical protein
METAGSEPILCASSHCRKHLFPLVEPDYLLPHGLADDEQFYFLRLEIRFDVKCDMNVPAYHEVVSPERYIPHDAEFLSVNCK